MSRMRAAADGIITVTSFDESLVAAFRRKVGIMAQSFSSDSPIVLHIDSFGGDMYALTAYLGILETLPNPIVTYTSGKAMSCGSILLTYGDVAVMGPQSVMMIHAASSYDTGKIPQLDMSATHNARIMNSIRDMYESAVRRRIADKKLANKAVAKVLAMVNSTSDHYLTPEQCKELGLIDHIGHIVATPSAFIDVRVVNEVRQQGIPDKAKAKKRGPAVCESKDADGCGKPSPCSPILCRRNARSNLPQ